MSASDSFFKSVVRYLPGKHRDPREDSLTQSLLALLKAEQSVASPEKGENLTILSSLIQAWGLEIDTQSVRIESQVIVQSSQGPFRIDLEVKAEDGALIWVEVKHGAHLSGDDQLQKYCAEMRALKGSSASRVVFLPPLGYGPVPKCGATESLLIETDWQKTGTAIKEWTANCRNPDPPVLWLANQFLKFLDEEGLYVDGTLDIRLLEQLESASRATRIVDSWLTQTDDRLANFLEGQDWYEGDYKRGRAKWPMFWSVFGTGHDEIRFNDTWLEWRIFESLQGFEGPVVGAGMTLGKSRDLSDFDLSESDSLLRAIDANGWGRIFGFRAVRSFAELDDHDLVDQVESLTEWVKACWAAARSLK